MKPEQTKTTDIQDQINALNEQISQPGADVHAINQKIRDLHAQQIRMQVEKLKDDLS